MSKYQEFQELFVQHGQDAHYQASHCFEAIEALTYRLIDYSGWFGDDVEYISLNQPIASSKAAKLNMGRVIPKYFLAPSHQSFWAFNHQ